MTRPIFSGRQVGGFLASVQEWRHRVLKNFLAKGKCAGVCLGIALCLAMPAPAFAKGQHVLFVFCHATALVPTDTALLISQVFPTTSASEAEGSWRQFISGRPNYHIQEDRCDSFPTEMKAATARVNMQYHAAISNQTVVNYENPNDWLLGQ
jgi:hypothetical protein